MVLEAIKMKEEKDLFGGSRLSSTVDFDTVEGIVNCYALENQTAKDGLYKFLKENGEITVRAVTYDNKINKVSKVKFEGDKYVVKVVR